MELIRRNADAWNCDPDRVAIMGFSAGGHLAAHYSTSFDCPEVREVFPHSHPVKASILCYPVITADPAFTHMGSIINLSGHDPITAEDTARFSCEKLVTDHTPPAFLWHTAEDGLVPVEQSIRFAQSCADHGVPVELHVFPFGPHGLGLGQEDKGPGTSQWSGLLGKFLTHHGF